MLGVQNSRCPLSRFPDLTIRWCLWPRCCCCWVTTNSCTEEPSSTRVRFWRMRRIFPLCFQSGWMRRRRRRKLLLLLLHRLRVIILRMGRVQVQMDRGYCRCRLVGEADSRCSVRCLSIALIIVEVHSPHCHQTRNIHSWCDIWSSLFSLCCCMKRANSEDDKIPDCLRHWLCGKPAVLVTLRAEGADEVLVVVIEAKSWRVFIIFVIGRSSARVLDNRADPSSHSESH